MAKGRGPVPRRPCDEAPWGLAGQCKAGIRRCWFPTECRRRCRWACRSSTWIGTAGVKSPP